MAYRDESGKITIDEQAAQKDIRRLREAANILKDSQASIRSLRGQSADMQGLAVAAIQDKSLEMEKKLAQMIEKLEGTADYIQKVVNHYQKIDEELKRMIKQQVSSAAEIVSGAISGKTPVVTTKPLSELDLGKMGFAGSQIANLLSDKK